MSTIGQYISTRLQQIGVNDYFVVPGDFNLVLLDEMLLNKNLNMISCCNELNAGYAADGYSRANGNSALVVTYGVGGLSAINAVAGAYAEDLPMIVISGGPNSNTNSAHQTLHHTIGLHDHQYVRDMYLKVTASAVIINDVQTAAYLIDTAIAVAIRQQKPVYIEIACNLANATIPPAQPLSFARTVTSDKQSLVAAVDSAAKMLNLSQKPTLVAGVKLRTALAINAMKTLIDAAGYGWAVMPNAKGFFDETQTDYLGVYWGSISSPGCAGIIESSDAYLFAGPTFTDYTTTGYSLVISPKKSIIARTDHVVVAGVVFNQVFLADFLTALARKIKPNPASSQAFKRIKEESIDPNRSDTDLIQVRSLFAHIERMLDDKSSLIIETGDSWFNGMCLNLPKGCQYEFQMQYGSIGWSTAATLGYAVATKNLRRVISCIGDGSFQLTAQEVANIIRYKLNPIIFLINNHGYTIEVEIHDGPYNNIKNWNYSELIQVFNADDGHAWGCQVKTEGELKKAIQHALSNKQLSFIEVIVDRHDCNKNLMVWGAKVAANNSLAPK